MMDLFVTNMQLFTSQEMNWWTGVVWIIVMFLSAVWTLILTAPIHSRRNEEINSSIYWMGWGFVNFSANSVNYSFFLSLFLKEDDITLTLEPVPDIYNSRPNPSASKRGLHPTWGHEPRPSTSTASGWAHDLWVHILRCPIAWGEGRRGGEWGCFRCGNQLTVQIELLL